ncbi:hypothetical protein DFJ74DRAFT_770067 [Hyaloraphidium curvatum]|nr:hypothetical protein DFJ74DRAFT_770067 [Hyaloraphidium curvatum]
MSPRRTLLAAVVLLTLAGAGTLCAAPSPPRALLIISTDCKANHDSRDAFFASKAPLLVPRSRRTFDIAAVDWSPGARCTGLPVDRIFRMPMTYKYPGVYRLANELWPGMLDAYDLFLLLDDDTDFVGGAAAADALFALHRAANWTISQPTLTATSVANHRQFLVRPNVLAHGAVGRRMSFIEQQAPVFTRAALQRYLPLFRNVTHAWGLDVYWSWDSATRHLAPGDWEAGRGEIAAAVDAIVVSHYKKISAANAPYREGGIEGANMDMAKLLNRLTGKTGQELTDFIAGVFTQWGHPDVELFVPGAEEILAKVPGWRNPSAAVSADVGNVPLGAD